MADRPFHPVWCGKGRECTCRSVEQDCPFNPNEKIRTTYSAREVGVIARESFLAGLGRRDAKLSDEELVGSDAVAEPVNMHSLDKRLKRIENYMRHLHVDPFAHE